MPRGLGHTVSFLLETRGIRLADQHLQRRVATQLVKTEAILDMARDRAGEVYKTVEDAWAVFVSDDDDMVVTDFCPGKPNGSRYWVSRSRGWATSSARRSRCSMRRRRAWLVFFTRATCSTRSPPGPTSVRWCCRWGASRSTREAEERGVGVSRARARDYRQLRDDQHHPAQSRRGVSHFQDSQDLNACLASLPGLHYLGRYLLLDKNQSRAHHRRAGLGVMLTVFFFLSVRGVMSICPFWVKNC